MDTTQQTIDSTAQDEQLLKQYKRQQFKEVMYRFFYNIWPAVQRTINFILYHTFRIIRGGIKTALEQLRQV